MSVEITPEPLKMRSQLGEHHQGSDAIRADHY